MKKILTVLTGLLIGLTSASAGDGVDLSAMNPENIIVLEVNYGTGSGEIIIITRPVAAPNHVARIKELSREGFYDGLIFHRVLGGFMAQTGDPKGNGTGGSGQLLDNEFNAYPHLRGTLSMARGPDDVNSADSQFFISYDRRAELDDEYTVWGRVVKGMQHVDALPKGEPPREPAKIVRMRVAADIEDWDTRF